MYPSGTWQVILGPAVGWNSHRNIHLIGPSWPQPSWNSQFTSILVGVPTYFSSQTKHARALFWNTPHYTITIVAVGSRRAENRTTPPDFRTLTIRSVFTFYVQRDVNNSWNEGKRGTLNCQPLYLYKSTRGLGMFTIVNALEQKSF